MDLCETKLQPGCLALGVVNILLFNWDSLGVEVLSISEDQIEYIKLLGDSACQACLCTGLHVLIQM